MIRLPPLTAARLACLYAAVFAVVGVHLPFWPVWLAAKGLGAMEIALVLAVSIGAKVIGNPVVAHLADRSGERRRPILRLALVSLASFALFAFADSFWPILAVSLLFFIVWPPIMPLAESLTMTAVGVGGYDYGRIRLWGSLSFIAAAVLSGHVLARHPASVLFWMVLAAAALTVVAASALPDLRAERAQRLRLPMIEVLRLRSFALFLAAATVIQGSHAVYYAFGTLHWRSLGYSDDVIGALWAEGVIAEIILFAAGDRVVRRLGPGALIVLGGVAGCVRWALTGVSDALPVLIAVQALHAFSFGASHLGAVHFIARAVPPGLSASAQSLYSTVVMGLGLGLLLFASGLLYASAGGGAYLVMAVLALGGAALAWPLRAEAGTPS